METVKVKDWMVSVKEYATISEDATLYEMVLALEEARQKFDVRGYRHRAVLVLDKNGRVIGKLSQLDVLRSLEPKYQEIEDLRTFSGSGLNAAFLRSMIDRYDLWEAPLDDICRKASRMKVRDLTSSPLEGELIDQEASVNQAAHQLIIGHYQSLLVTSKGKVVGILRLGDVFQEVSKRIRACRA